MQFNFYVCLVVGGLAGSTVAFAGEQASANSASGFRISGSVGRLDGAAHEYVYNPDRTKLSELIWDMEGNIGLNGDVEWGLTDRLKMSGSFSVGLDGNNKMDDYDWLIAPYNDWSHHSISSDTRLDHYLSIDAGLTYAAVERESWKLLVIGGAKYTDVKWTAYGGDFVYSSDPGFRDLTGSFPDAKAISYQLMLPAIYAGLGVEHQFDEVTLGISAVAGVSFDGSDEDNHWMRTPPLTFLEDFGAAPYVGLKARATYALTDRTGIMILGKYERYFTAKGDTTLFENGSQVNYFGGDVAGANLETISISAGLNFEF